MNIVTIKMDVAIPDEIGTNLDAIVSYLNNMLNYNVEFFGDFQTENIDCINEEDGTHIYSFKNGYSSWVKNNA